MSGSDEIMPFHLNTRHLEKFQEKFKVVNYSLDNVFEPTNFLEYFLLASYRLAQALWIEMVNLENNEIGMTHDGYLKIYQLSKPKIDGYDCIMLDEAQDANAPVLDILNNQTCQRIYVGDSNQQIYAWRGSVDAMKKLQGIELYLTKSFRFGPNVAQVANHILKTLKETRTLVGNSELNTRIAPVDINKPYTVIFRTNAALFNECLVIAAKGKKIHIVGGLKQPLELFASAYYLWKGEIEKVATASIKHFYTWERFSEEATLSNDSDLMSTKNFIERYKDETLEILTKIKNSAKYTEKQARVILVTGHRAKGREWDQVIIYADFPSLQKAKGQELNLLYVSATRAMQCLEILPDLNFSLEKRLLTIELVPQTCWFSNVRSNVSTADWNKLKKISARQAGNKCEICNGQGDKWPVECHEIWHYDDEKKIQSLNGLISLCPSCHEVKHMGFANMQNRGHIAQDHLAKINGWSQEKTSQYVQKQFDVWLERSKYEWKLDISWLEKQGISAVVSDRNNRAEHPEDFVNIIKDNSYEEKIDYSASNSIKKPELTKKSEQKNKAPISKSNKGTINSLDKSSKKNSSNRSLPNKNRMKNQPEKQNFWQRLIAKVASLLES